jgi:hypothetical protein
MREAITGDKGELHNEELHCSYCSLSVIQVFKSRRMTWWGMGIWHMWGRGEMYTGFW